jgi:beta-glucanase (GH16 family)
MTRRLNIVVCAVVLAACSAKSGSHLSGADAATGMRGGPDASSAGAAGKGHGGTGGSGAANGGTGGGTGGTGGTGGKTSGAIDASVHDAAARDAATHDASVHDAGTAQDAAVDSFDPGPRWKLTWRDEFDGPAGTSPDASRWVFETGGNGFGNNELEFYTARTDNAALDGSGSLVITARKESYMGRQYTSARLKTQGKFEHQYGRFEARIRIPKGQGIWPAFWMLGNDIGTTSWPGCGEIDIMENVGKEPTTVHGTIHGPGYSGGGGLGAPYMLTSKAPFADDFHVYAVEWTAGQVRWLVDDQVYETRTTADLPAGKRWVYDHPFFLLLNVAVGGQWPGSPDGTTQFPQMMSVDFVRVYDAVP